MDIHVGRARVTDTLGTKPGVLAEDRVRLAMKAATSRTEPTERFQTSGALAEVPYFLEPTRSLAPLMPRGLRGRVSKPKAITILLVDDNEIDVIAIRRSFWQLKIPNPIIVARNGLEALDILRGRGGHAKIAAPYLILLDLHLPRIGGIEFLGELRGDPTLRRTLVFVMTRSAEEQDRERAYEKNVAGFVLKDRPGQSFMQVISALEGYWRGIELPD